eukprot:TRINITY_DN5249_c1_g1_i1.p1 TRINITY_DN5249_c1_g1~~TRINITY_DN5249_c1_g1_i1.p1  ORF type:complete len:549 (+),score=103.37 TRINITY_DN5249_c1_g1_i1:35-1648(+)
MVWLRTLAFHLIISSGRSMVLNRKSAEATSSAASYLSKYGYLTQSTSVETESLVDLGNAVEEFQKFAGIEVTGELDDLTLELMQRPRCGVKDIVDDTKHREKKDSEVTLFRTKRYALQGSRWRVKDLTYRISKYPSSRVLSRSDVDRTMRKAFDVWERVTDLKFEEKKPGDGKVHIDIRFEKRNHGDDDPFDGEGGTLAHAFFPVFGGDAHFDEEEDWTVDTPRGTSLLMSAAHELGHSLGLSHSNDRSALMAPFYRGYEENVSLAQDDIDGIEALYGEKEDNRIDDYEADDNRDFFPRRADNPVPSRPSTTRRPPTTTRRTTPRPPPPVNNRALCRDGKVDAMVTLKNDTTYAFKGSQYWKLTETSVETGYPRSITRDWDGMPGDIDAAFTWTNGRTYFFKGSRYWRFTDGSLDDGYPKNMDVGFGGIPSNVDAAMVWPQNNKIYFFKGSRYWKFDPESSPPVSDSYPRTISNWDGIPNNLDAAVQYSNGKIYFFKNGKYYRWNDDTFSVDTGNPSYPRDTGFWWFGCKNSPLRAS